MTLQSMRAIVYSLPGTQGLRDPTPYPSVHTGWGYGHKDYSGALECSFVSPVGFRTCLGPVIPVFFPIFPFLKGNV
jgi:hypothetical protein